MMLDDVRTVVNEHRCQIEGIAYTFTLVGLATEKQCDPALARHVLDVECEASGDADSTERLRFLVGVRDLGDIRALLTDALLNCLAEHDISTTDRAESPRHSTPAARKAARLGSTPHLRLR